MCWMWFSSVGGGLGSYLRFEGVEREVVGAFCFLVIVPPNFLIPNFAVDRFPISDHSILSFQIFYFQRNDSLNVEFCASQFSSVPSSGILMFLIFDFRNRNSPIHTLRILSCPTPCSRILNSQIFSSQILSSPILSLRIFNSPIFSLRILSFGILSSSILSSGILNFPTSTLEFSTL